MSDITYLVENAGGKVSRVDLDSTGPGTGTWNNRGSGESGTWDRTEHPQGNHIWVSKDGKNSGWFNTIKREWGYGDPPPKGKVEGAFEPAPKFVKRKRPVPIDDDDEGGNEKEQKSKEFRNTEQDRQRVRDESDGKYK